MPDFTARITEIQREHEKWTSWGLTDEGYWCPGCERRYVDFGAHLAALIAAAAEEYYRPKIETVEQRDLLPVTTVLKEDFPSGNGAVWERWNASSHDRAWVRLDSCAHLPGQQPLLPAIVVWPPGGER